jgi:hypothetical protein
MTGSKVDSDLGRDARRVLRDRALVYGGIVSRRRH